MGRTLPTHIQLLNDEERAWKSFRRALRKEDQAVFDRLWSYARHHAVAASMASRPLPYDAYFLSMILGVQKDLQAVKSRI